MDELIIKSLSGESSETENQTLISWIAADVDHSKYFEEMELIWNTSKKLGLQGSGNEEMAWAKFKGRVSETKTKKVKLTKLTWVNVAASLVFMLSMGWFAYQQLKSPNQMIAQTLANTKVVSLPDGSTVTLNKYTRVNFPEKFTGEFRDVKLVGGEAFFSIKPDKDKPFVIQTENSSIRVVGTSFNVKCTSEKTEVTVETGAVEVTKKERSIALKPGERVIVDNHYSAMQKQDITDRFYNYYITKEFVANSTPLWRLVEVLNDTYDVKIIIKDEHVKNLKLTTTFKNESLESIIDVISETFQLKATKENNLIILQ